MLEDYWIPDTKLGEILVRNFEIPDQESTYYFPPGRTIRHLNPTISCNLDPITERKLCDILGASNTGAVIFWAGEKGYLIEPPFPILDDVQFSRYEFDPLINVLNKERVIGVIALRLGRFAVGVYRGRELIGSKTGSKYVKGRHRAGGSSARRFERIREKQKKELFDKVCNVVSDQFSSYWGQLDRVFLSGERMTLNGFLLSCEKLAPLRDLVAKRVLNIREPSHKALELLPQDIWRCHVYEFSNEVVSL